MRTDLCLLIRIRLREIVTLADFLLDAVNKCINSFIGISKHQNILSIAFAIIKWQLFNIFFLLPSLRVYFKMILFSQ